MYGDTSVIRGLARALRDRAGEIRHEADTLVAQVEHTPWTGLAAAALRLRARERAAVLRRTATRHEDAADALLHHAAEVDRLKDLIASIERTVRAMIDTARDRLTDLAGGVLDGVRDLAPDPIDALLGRFSPPPHGSMAWLDVDLPGVA